MPRWVDEAVGEYAKRFGRDVNYALKRNQAGKRGAGVNAAQAWRLKKTPAGSHTAGRVFGGIDERGKAPTSVELAQYLKAGSKTVNMSALLLAAQTA